MKYVVVLYDGMADYPVPALGGKTPMAVAKKPNLDFQMCIRDSCNPGVALSGINAGAGFFRSDAH